jgi:hypothetical protein
MASAGLWYIGSPQSKEEEERNQEIKLLMRNIDKQKAEIFIIELEKKYPKK